MVPSLHWVFEVADRNEMVCQEKPHVGVRVDIIAVTAIAADHAHVHFLLVLLFGVGFSRGDHVAVFE